jgi:uncharacterized membrane protein
MQSSTPLADITAAARAGLSGSWGKSIGILILYGLLLAGVNYVPVAGGFLQLIFAAPLVVGLHAFFLATVRNQNNPLGLLFEGFNRFGTSWCAYMLVVLIIAGWMLPMMLLLVPLFVFVHPDPAVFPGYTLAALGAILVLTVCGIMILLQMRYYLVLYIVADDPSVRARDAVSRSVELMSGNYWRLCLLWLRFIGWQLLCVLTFGIGFIWLAPYMTAATAAFYDDLNR